MKFIKGVPDLKILQNDQYIFEIKSVQRFDEDEDRVILKCAEEISEFKRGFVCDMNCSFTVEDTILKVMNMRNDTIKDLVLVYINKQSQYGYIPEFEYVFYK